MFLIAIQVRGASAKVALSNGVVTYTAQDGRRLAIQVGRKCADLWVSPDHNAIAFIAIHKAEPVTAQVEAPFIEESTIYLAFKSDHFRPVNLVLKPIVIIGRVW